MGLGVLLYAEEERRTKVRRMTTTIATMESSQLGPRLIEESFTSRYSSSVREALDELLDCFTITDPCISGHPIVYASPGFLKMSGYSRDEVIGKNGRFFQGPKTDRRSVTVIREAIREERTVQITLLNYRKDGTPFWMLFHLCPVFSKDDGRVIHFVAVQLPLSRKLRNLGSDDEGDFPGTDSRRSTRPQEIVFGSCRREVSADSVFEFGCVQALGSVVDLDNRGLDPEECCEASETEKQRIASVIDSIISLLSQYSKLTGRLVSNKQCCAVRNPLGSSTILSLGRIQQSFVLCDPHAPDVPILYASDAFLSLTGYARHEVLGQNCRFLQGSDTDDKAICEIRESIQGNQSCSVRILNYRKDGSSFWNLLHISPVRNATGKIAFYVGVQIEEGCKNEDDHGFTPEMRQRSVVGAVRVAVRTLSMGAGPSKS